MNNRQQGERQLNRLYDVAPEIQRVKGIVCRQQHDNAWHYRDEAGYNNPHPSFEIDFGESL